MSKLVIEYPYYSPYIDLKCKGTNVSVDKLIDAFTGFANALGSVLGGETLKELVERIAKLPGEAKDV